MHRILKAGFIQILSALIVVLFPFKSYSACPNASGDIPFFVTNEAKEDVCIQCGGPWLRGSGEVNIDEGAMNCEFYAANKTAFSPYGKWNCISISSCDASEPVIVDSIFFCVQYAPPDADNSVSLLIEEGKKLFTNQPSPPCSDSVPSFLGNNSKQEKSKPDTDTFKFDGTEGDDVKLRLEADPQGGNNRGDASLGIGGNPLDESTTGTLPLEINTTLPADREYSVTVAQPRISEDQRFRGSYILRLESSEGVDLIKPTNNVEK